MTYHIVEFHADGGQTCIPGRRVFTEKPAADSFAERMRNEEGHSCGPESVRQYVSDTDPGRVGEIYPAIANLSLPIQYEQPSFWNRVRSLFWR